MLSNRTWCWALCHSFRRREHLQFCAWSARWIQGRLQRNSSTLALHLAWEFGGTCVTRVVGSALAGLVLLLNVPESCGLRVGDVYAAQAGRSKPGRTRGMAWRASGRSNAELVQNLKRVGLIESAVVEKAFLAVDRRHFVPVSRRAEQPRSETPAHAGAPAGRRQDPISAPSPLVFPSPRTSERDEFAQNDPYEDSPQYIGYYATISAPHIQAMCAELLLPYVGRPGARVLDIGSGTGYLTAIFAKMGEFALQVSTETSVGHHRSPGLDQTEAAAAPSMSSVVLPRVFGVDHIRPLVEDSERNVRASNPELIAEQRVLFKADDGRLGWPEYAPYDAIHVGAAADVVPRPLLEQLKPGGRLVIPIGPEGGDQKLVAIDRDEADPSKYVQKDITGVRYVPLCDLAYQWQGALSAETEEEEEKL